jgi:hypothetical protein
LPHHPSKMPHRNGRFKWGVRVEARRCSRPRGSSPLGSNRRS